MSKQVASRQRIQQAVQLAIRDYQTRTAEDLNRGTLALSQEHGFKPNSREADKYEITLLNLLMGTYKIVGPNMFAMIHGPAISNAKGKKSD